MQVVELLQIPRLRLRLRAGAGGLHHPVSWTQTSDLESPWDWMTSGELLLKNGCSMPAESSRQRALITQLVRCGAAGLVIGMDADTPPLDAVDQAADAEGLPVLEGPLAMSFSAITETVADSRSDRGPSRAHTIERVYEVLRQSVSEPAGRPRELARSLGCQLAVIDTDAGVDALDDPDFAPCPDDLRSIVLAETKRRAGRMPGVVHLDFAGSRAEVVEVPDTVPTLMIAYGHRQAPPDFLVLQHTAAAVAVLLAQQAARIEQRRRTGAELFNQLLENRLRPADAVTRLASRGLVAGDCVVLSAPGAVAENEGTLHILLQRRGIPNLLVRRQGHLCALLPGQEVIPLVQRLLGPEAGVGVSDCVAEVTRIRAALREAVWAAHEAAGSITRLQHYAESSLLSVLGDADEARLLVDRILGKVIAYDQAHGTELVRTLGVHLTCNRAWQPTAQRLGVHRQTAVYRIRRIEEITGRDLTATSDIAWTWLALQAWGRLQTS